MYGVKGANTRVASLLGAGWEGDDTAAFRSLMTELADGFAKKDASALVARVTSSGPNTPAPSAADIAAMNEALFARNDAVALSACARGMTTLFEVPADRLRAVTIPVLAIVGELDTPNVASVARLKTVVRGLDVVQLPGANHATSVRPSAAPLLAFLDKHRN